jgi:hypothetical protein
VTVEKQLIEIRHANPDDFLHWEVFLDGKRIENMVGFTLDVGMDYIPQLTIKVHAIDVKVDTAVWDPNLPGVSWREEEELAAGIVERDQDASPDPWEGTDVHQQD